MRKEFLFIVAALTLVNVLQAQTRGTKVGYIDMEYILQNVPNYTEAQSQLEQKAQQWKQEVETKKIEINKLTEALKAEKALLTKGLIEERTAEITFLENENLEYQQKRFGPNGDLMTQKAGLTKPIQDQVFSAIQDIAEAKKYDFIFDKTSDLTMLFAAKRFDISDQIVRVLNRTEKREQLTKKQLKEEEAKEAKEEAINDNPALSARQQSLDAKKATRDAAIADRLALQEQRKQAAEDKRLQIVADREAKRNGTDPTIATTETADKAADKEAALAAATEAKQLQADERAKALESRKQAAEDKKKALEERKLQILADREAKKTNAAPTTAKTTTVGNTTDKEAALAAAAEAKQLQADDRAKSLEIRKQAAEDKKKALEEKRLQILADRETKKTTVAPAASNTEVAPVNVSEKQTSKTTAAEAAAEAKQKQADARLKAMEDRRKIAEDNKKAIEEKRKQAIEAKESKKTGTVSENKIKEETKTPATDAEPAKAANETATAEETTTKTTAEEAKQKQAEARATTLEERNKVIEERKKAAEEKRKKILEAREAAKKAQEEKLKTIKENTNNN
jgi:Skp family chaperone for outer membrane proteins